MRFVVEIGQSLIRITELDEKDFREASQQDIYGVPVYCYNNAGVWYFWPRPIGEVKVYKLDSYSYADGRLA